MSRASKSTRLGPLLWAWFLSAAACQGATEFPRDPGEHYASRFLIATLVTAIAVTLYSLLKYHGRPKGSAGWGMLLLSVCVLPPVCFLPGTFLVFARAERVEFCGSCHSAMHAYVTDMQDGNSHSLAAVHYRNRYIPQNQCFVCHTSFGLFGTMQAKVSGIDKVRKYYLDAFRPPIRMQEPFRNGECLKCHGEAERWKTAHSEVRSSLFSDRLRCLNCHGWEQPAHAVRAQERL